MYAMPTAWMSPASTGERGVESELGAVGELDLAGRESVDADLRSLQIAEHTHVSAGALGGGADQLEAPRVIGRYAVREIHAHHIDPGAHHVVDDLGIVRRRAQGRDDLGAAQNEAHAARRSRMSTAGSFLPSTNSRKAPPPVDM